MDQQHAPDPTDAQSAPVPKLPQLPLPPKHAADPDDNHSSKPTSGRHRVTPRSSRSQKQKGTMVVVSSRATESGARVLTPRDLRDITHYIASNQKLNHSNRSGNLSERIPDSPFHRVDRDKIVDEGLGLTLSRPPKGESALDVPLRLMPPQHFHLPPVVDPKSKATPAEELLTALRGGDWQPRRTATTGDNTAKPQHLPQANSPRQPKQLTTRDYELRAAAMHRSEKFFQEALAYMSLGILHYNALSYTKAVAAFGNAIPLMEQVGDAQGVAVCNNMAATCYHRLGQYDNALHHHMKQASISGAMGKAVAQVNMAVEYCAVKEFKYAVEAATDAVSNAVHTGDNFLESVAFGNLGLANLRLGSMKDAQTNLEHTLERCSLGGDKFGAAVVLLLIGEVYMHIRDFEHAEFYYSHAFRVASEINDLNLAEVARVSVGVSRGSKVAHQSMQDRATEMGLKPSVRSVISTLPDIV